jgi:hypothetical protein
MLQASILVFIQSGTGKLTTEKQVQVTSSVRLYQRRKMTSSQQLTISTQRLHNAPERKPAEPPTDSSINDDKITTASADNNVDFPISGGVLMTQWMTKITWTGPSRTPTQTLEPSQSQTKLNEDRWKERSTDQ